MSAHRAIRARRTRPSVNIGMFLTVVMVFTSILWAGPPTFTVNVPSHHVQVGG